MHEIESTGSRSPASVFRPAEDVVSRRVDDAVVLVRLTTNRIYELNSTGARLWELLQEGATTDAIIEQVGREFGVKRDLVGAEILDLLHELHAEGLVV